MAAIRLAKMPENKGKLIVVREETTVLESFFFMISVMVSPGFWNVFCVCDEQTIHASFGERYLSSILFDELRKEAEAMKPVSVD